MSNLKEDLASLKIDHSERGGGGRKGRWIIGALLIVALGGGGWYWSTRLQAAPVKVATVAVKASGGSGAGAVLNASGYVTARRRATVSSKVTGKVVQIFVEEGQAVRQGQVLARLDDSQARAQLAYAQAEVVGRAGRAPRRIRRGSTKRS